MTLGTLERILSNLSRSLAPDGDPETLAQQGLLALAEALGALRVADLAVIVVDAKDGPGVGTMQVWEWATQFGLPKVFVINGVDRENADFERTLAQIRQFAGERVFPLSLPLESGPGFQRVLDVPRSEIIT
ncbi:MAG: hypothetical protein K6T35_13730, partial [Meiothermus silvanus]|nr:hypothetical protein [Allomeiothermus silvanus]